MVVRGCGNGSLAGGRVGETMMATRAAGDGVGTSMRRVEDRRLLEGGGEYLADLRVPGAVELAFLRSPVAHARPKGVDIPTELRGSVFLAEDIGFSKPIVAASAAPGFRYSEYLALVLP
jgi:carbon-monoxide dehydrogenase large subunit